MLQPVTFWFADIRKAALIACIVGVLGVLMPGWNATQAMVALESTHPLWKWWIIPCIVLLYLFLASLPVFCFALYRNEGTLRFPKRLRLLSLAAAFVFSIMVALGLPEWIASLRPYWTAMKTLDWRIGATGILTAARDPRTISHFSTMLGEFSNLAYILLLIALFRHTSDESYQGVPVSRLLSFVTKVAVIAWGLWLAFILLTLVVTPYSYFQLRNYALQIGRTPPQLGGMVARNIRSLLDQACLFVAPYTVYKSGLGPGLKFTLLSRKAK